MIGESEIHKRYSEKDYLNMLEHNIRNAISVTTLFDKGNFESSTLLIGIIRTLVYDTPRSTSLVKRLGDKENIYFLDTSIKAPPDTFHLQNFLFLAYVRKPNEEEYYRMILPKFYFENDMSNTVSFDEWWDKTVIIKNGIKFSRKNIILLTAHKHGILHSDKSVDSVYYDLANNVLSFAYHTETEDIEDPNVKIDPADNSIFSLIRQIAHELLLSLINFYDLDMTYEPVKEEEAINITYPIYDLTIAVDPEFHEENKDIIKSRKN